MGLGTRLGLRGAEERRAELVYSLHCVLFCANIHSDFVLINVDLWQRDILDKIDQLIGLLLILGCGRPGVPPIDEGLKPLVELLTMMKLIDPKHHEVHIVKVEDRLLVLGPHLEVVLVLFLIPRGLRNETCLDDVTQLEDVVGRDGKFIGVLIGYKDSLYRVDVDIALIAVELEAVNFVETALDPLERVEDSIGGL